MSGVIPGATGVAAFAFTCCLLVMLELGLRVQSNSKCAAGGTAIRLCDVFVARNTDLATLISFSRNWVLKSMGLR